MHFVYRLAVCLKSKIYNGVESLGWSPINPIRRLAMSTHRYNREEQTIPAIDLKLLYVSFSQVESQMESDWHSTLHAHQCTEIFYVTSGAGTFQIEQTRVPVKANDVIIVNPNVEHTECRKKDNPMHYIVVGLDGGHFLMKNSEDNRYYLLENNQSNAKILQNIQEILHEYMKKDSYYIEIAHRSLEILFLKLIRQQHIRSQKLTSPKKRQVCVKVRQYIDNNYSSNITLDDLADMVHLNKYYLVHAFTKEFGMSPINYMLNRRLEEAQYLLVNTNYSITLISELLGFSSASYFTQSFQRIVEMSPKQYRNATKKNPAASLETS